MHLSSVNTAEQSKGSKTEVAATPSAVITPTPELEASLGRGLRIVPRSVNLHNERRRYRIEAVYPQLEGSKSRGIFQLNRQIKDLVSKQYQWTLIPTTTADHRHYQKWPGVFNSVDLNYQVVLATDHLVSLYFDVYSYGIGAAHSVQHSFTMNIDLAAEKQISLAKLFRADAKYLEFISAYCLREMSRDHPTVSDPTFKDELAPKLKNYESWNITEEGLRFNFDACQIDGCAAGKDEVVIQFPALKEKMNPKSLVSSLATP
jgi:Protein of unknown function (DUF3298)/Deacetylase PdaC